MASGNFVQNDFTGGEWSQVAQGQTSEPRYKKAMNVCLNGYPMEEKPWVRRSGTRHAAPSRGGVPARTVQLNFTGKAPYTMEFTDGFLRMFSGPSLLKNTSASIITAISSDMPAIITLQSAATWETGTEIEFLATDIKPYPGVAYLANRQFKVQKVDTTHFSLFDSVTSQPVDGSKVSWGVFTLRANEVVSFATSYDAGEWRTLKAVQSDKRILLLSSTVAPQVLNVLSLPTDTAPASFELTDFQFKDGPYLDPVDGSIITSDQTLGLVNMTLSFTDYSATRAYKKGDFVSSSSIGYRSLQDVNLNHTPASSPAYWEQVSPGAAVGPNGFTTSDIGRLLRFKDSAGNWSWGRITGLSNTGAIDGGLAGSINFAGNFGNVDRAFDGVASKTSANSAGFYFGSGSSPIYSWIGKNYTANGGRAISSMIVYPSSDLGFTQAQYMGTQINLRASMTAPASSSDGTLLGSSASVITGTQGAAPLVIASNDTSTVWNYVWAENITSTSGDNNAAYISSVQFFGAGAAPAGSGVQVQILGPALATTSPMSVWRLGAYSDSTGWPTCGCYHEGRLFLGGAIENRWDASESNDINSFSPTAFTAGTVSDNNAISYTFNSAKINKILWMRSTSEGIVFGNQSGEGQIKATQANLPLSPTNAQAHLVTEYGCADVEPVLTGLTTVFVHRFKRQVYEYLTDAYSGKFFGRSLTRDVKHLVKDGVEEMTYQQERTPIVWGRTGTNGLIGMTYRRISQFSTQEAEVLGWHRHELGSGRSVESICTGPSVDGSIDALAMVTNDSGTSVRHIEMMTNSFLETDEITDARFLDNHIVPVNGTKVAKVDGDYIRFSGLWHLNSKKVTVFAAGLDCGDIDVVDGSVDVKLGVAAGGAFTIAKLTELTTSGTDFGDLAVSIDGGMFTIPAVVGFTYTSRGQLLRPTDSEDSRWGRTGAQNGPAFGKLRRLQETAFQLVKTAGIKFGTSFDRLRTVNFRTDGGVGLTASQLFSGIATDNMPDDAYSTDGMICWEVSRPYPATISAVGGYLSTQDK